MVFFNTTHVWMHRPTRETHLHSRLLLNPFHMIVLGEPLGSTRALSRDLSCSMTDSTIFKRDARDRYEV